VSRDRYDPSLSLHRITSHTTSCQRYGGVDPETITFDLCREWIDEFVTVSEDEIVYALRLIVGEERIVMEGAAAVAVAGYHKLSPASAIIVLSGANIATETLVRVFEPPAF
jgi:threonine dehydratase